MLRDRGWIAASTALLCNTRPIGNPHIDRHGGFRDQRISTAGAGRVRTNEAIWLEFHMAQWIKNILNVRDRRKCRSELSRSQPIPIF
jgi:hypothetical protein